MFVPFEGIYSEITKNSKLLEEIQFKYKIIVTGPTTLGALLNSLQMGFKTLAIQEKSSEVWDTLSKIKTEFKNLSGVLDKAHKSFTAGMNHMEDAVGPRTRAISRNLSQVDKLDKTLTNPELKYKN
jgi:DNA recombination protein RmuC